MKILLIILFLTVSSSVSAQWLADQRLTNDVASSMTSYNTGKSIFSKGDTLHIIFKDTRDGNSEIYYKRSIDNGTTWGSDVRLTNNASFSDNPTISGAGNSLHISWRDTRGGDDEIYYKTSSDGGTTWSGDIRLTNNSFSQYNPAISTFGQIVIVVWNDLRNGNSEIYYKRSSNGGSNWSIDTRLTNNDSSSLYPSISNAGQVFHLSWTDRKYGNNEILYRSSPDGGLSWLPERRITNDTASSENSFATGIGQNSFVFWNDTRDGNLEAYFRKSTDLGTTWGAETRLTNDFSASGICQAEVYGNNIHLSFVDSRNANLEIYYKYSSDLGISWGPDTRITNDPANSYYPSISLSGQNLHLVWLDDRDGNQEIYYKKNPTGNVITVIEPIAYTAEEYKLEQNYPNPFNPYTNLKFKIKNANFVKLSVYDIAGKEVAILVNAKLNPGEYEYSFNGAKLTSGIYFYKLATEGFTEVKKMMLVK